MATTQAQRAALFNTLAELMGQDDAETLTEQLPPGGWDHMATKDDIKVVIATFTAALAETNAAMRVGFAETTAAFTAALAETNTTMATGFAHAAEERAKITTALTAALAETNTAMAAGFAHAAEERAKITTALTAALAETNTAMAAGFAHATEERAKITAAQARHLYVTVATIVVATVSIWIALLVAPAV